MSVVGIDFGTRCSTIAVLVNRKVEVIANEVSLRQTAGAVGLTFKQRELGEQGLDQFARNARNTVLGVKALLGRKLQDPQLKQMLRSMGACKWVEHSNGNIAVEVSYLGQQKVFTAEQLTAMLLTKLKSITEAATGVGMVACVVSVPGWWSSAQRTSLLNAAKIAALPIIRIVNDCSAIAFNYGFFHPTAFPNPTPMLYMDMGYSSFQCSVVEMSGPSCKVLASGYDTTTGGWEIDQLLADFFAKSFNQKNGLTIQNDPRAWLKLLGLVEKAKKTLNMNDLAVVGMECICDGCDLSEKITRDEYMGLLAGSGIIEKVINTIQKTLDKANLKPSDLHSIEWTGSCLRVTAIRDAIQKFFGEKQVSAQMNAEEGVAIGCALMCARMSPTASTRPYDLIENTARAVTLSFVKLNEFDAKEQSFQLFNDNYSLPKTKALNSTFPEAKPISLEMRYTDKDSVVFGNDVIATARVPEVVTSGFPSKLRVKSKAEPHGVFGFVQADLLEEKEETYEVPIEEPKPVEQPKAPEPEKKETTPDGEEKMVEDKPDTPEDTPMKDEKPKTRIETRKVTHETALKFEVVNVGVLTPKEVEAFRMEECEMKRADALVIATANAKNELETFAYACPDKCSGEWKEFGSPEEFAALKDVCEKTTAWLYDEGENVSKEEYEAKMAAIKVFSEPIRLRLAAKVQAELDRIKAEEDRKKAEEEAKKKEEAEAKKVAEEAKKKAEEEAKKAAEEAKKADEVPAENPQ